MVEVTESAKAAIDLLTKIEEYDHACDCDDCNSLRTHTLPFVVQAFATHRIEAAKAERDRIVAWLRSDGPDRDNGGPCRHVEHSQGTCICNELADAAIATMFERLRDPATVHVNMLRGGIAKPSPTNIWHIYGRELLADMPKEYAAEEKAKLFERLRTPSEGMIWQRAYRDMTDVELRDIVAASANGQLSRSLFAPATAELQRRAKTPVTPPTSQKPER